MTEDLKKWRVHCGIYCKRCPGVESFRCKGCRGLKSQIFKFPVFKTYKYFTGKGYEFCYEYADFACELLQPIVNFKILKPHNSKVYNSVMI